MAIRPTRYRGVVLTSLLSYYLPRQMEARTLPTQPSIRTEAIAGITTFFTMAYIVVVNPSILSTPGTGMAFSGVLTATVLVCFVMTLLMGLYAKLPFAVAPGMGINAYFTFTIILTQKVWSQWRCCCSSTSSFLRSNKAFVLFRVRSVEFV